MIDNEIKARRKLLRDKAAALKQLQEIGDISYDEYSQQIAQIQIERRKLKNAAVIDAEAVSVEQLSTDQASTEARNLPARLPVYHDIDGDGQKNATGPIRPYRNVVAEHIERTVISARTLQSKVLPFAGTTVAHPNMSRWLRGHA